MIKNLTSKQWFYIYLAGILLALIIVFQVAISPTLGLRKSCKEKEFLLKSLSTAPQEIRLIAGKLNNIDKQLNKKSKSGYDTRDDLLEEISNYCVENRIKVFSYPELHIYNNKSFIVESNILVVKGSFKRLLNLIHHMESTVGYSRIASLKYYTELNRKTKREELFLEIIFQNIKDYE